MVSSYQTKQAVQTARLDIEEVIPMKQFYVGEMVSYQNETKEWKVIRAELAKDGNVEYTIEKASGRSIGKKEIVLVDLID